MTLLENVRTNDFLDFTKRKVVASWVVPGVVISILVTAVTLLQTFEGFYEQVFGKTPVIYLLILLNALFTLLMIVLVRTFTRPTATLFGHAIYASVIALTFQSVVHTPLPLATDFVDLERSSAEQAEGGPEGGRLDLGELLYDPLAGAITRPVYIAVREEMRQEVRSVVDAYDTEDGAERFRAMLEQELELRPEMSSNERDDLKNRAIERLESEEICEGQAISCIEQRVFSATVTLYSAGRDLVQGMVPGTEAQ